MNPAPSWHRVRECIFASVCPLTQSVCLARAELLLPPSPQPLVPRVQRPLNDRASRVLDEGSVEASARGGEGRLGTGRARYTKVHW